MQNHPLNSSFSSTAFGMALPERTWTSDSVGYRFGFNGMEMDNEVKGGGNSLDFGARIYDSRLGRWFSIDPLAKKYPNESNYAFVSNNSILYKDIGGKDKEITIIIKTEMGSFQFVVTEKNVVEFGMEKYSDGMGGSNYRPTAYDVKQTITFDLTTGKTEFGRVTQGRRIGFWNGVSQTLKRKSVQVGGIMFTAEDGAGSSGIKAKTNDVDVTDIGSLMTYLRLTKFGPDGKLPDIKENPEEFFDVLSGAIEAMFDLNSKSKNVREEQKKCYRTLCNNPDCRLNKEENMLKDIEEGKMPSHSADMPHGYIEGEKVEVPCKPKVEKND